MIICLLWLPPVDSQAYEIGCRSNFVHHYTFCCCLVAQLCPTFSDHMDCRPPFSVPGISQARTLEWVAVSFFRGSSWPRDRTHVSGVGSCILHLWATGQSCMLLFVDIFYIVVAEKYPLPALKEECGLIILTNAYSNSHFSSIHWT